MAASPTIRFNYSVLQARPQLKDILLIMAVVGIPVGTAIGIAIQGSYLAWIVVAYYLAAWFGGSLFGSQYVELTDAGIRIRAAYYRYLIPYGDAIKAGKCDDGEGGRLWKLIGVLSGRGWLPVTTCVHFRTRRLFPIPLFIPPLPVPCLVRCLSLPLSTDDAIAFAVEVNRRRAVP